MPIIRYQIRNEYGLADPELYGAAERDDPEALLEGVAMAGLVGVLRQLGDLAEFGAEIFHSLHEEVMTTAARGHGLMLRVQQLEAEFPSIEKAFFTHTNNSSFACNDGIDWHSNIEMDQNLITRGDMPRFILDSYEECRGPPRLFTLDKFDVAGAGACLKRYSDPSFFKMELPSSRMLEMELPREKKARKIKKGSQWKNNQTLESLLAPYADSDLQPISSDHVSEKTLRHVRLKPRPLNGMQRSNERSLMEHLLEVHSSEQNILFGNSVNHSHVTINPIDSNEPASEIHEIGVDASADHPLVRNPNPIQSSIKKQVAGLPSYELETQKIKNKEFSEALHYSFSELRKTDSDYFVMEQKEMSTESGYKSDGNVDGDVSGVPGKISPVLQVVNQNKLLGDAEVISERRADGYRSDDISSELDNFVDALNTIESDIETDSGSGAIADTDVLIMESHGKDSDTNEAQQELPAQFSEPDSVGNSTKSLSSDNMFMNAITSTSDSDSSSSTVAQPTQKNMVSLPASSEICLGKTYERTTETDFEDTAKSDQGVFNMESHGKDSDSNEAQWELHAHFPAPDSVDNSTKSLRLNNILKSEMACVSDSYIATSSVVAQPIQRNMVSIDLLAESEICPGKKSHDRTTEELWQNTEAMKLNHFVSSPCVIDSTSILVSIHPQGSTHESQSITGDQKDLPSSNEAPDANEATKFLDGLPLESDHLEMLHLVDHVQELISEDIAETFDMLDHLSQIEYRSMSRQAPSGYIEDLLLQLPASVVGESQESVEPDSRACSGVGESPVISAFSPAINSITSHLDGLATNLQNGMLPEDIHVEISSGFVEDRHDIAEEFNGSCLGTQDEDVPENMHPSGYPLEQISEDTAITLDMTNHRFQARDECTLGKGPTGFGEDSTLPSDGYIGELHKSMKQDTEAYLGGSTSSTVPALSPDISFTVQLEGSAAEMEKVVAPSEHLACLSSSLENAEEMVKGNISIPNKVSPEFEYFSDVEQPREFPHVISAGFTRLYSVEETCPSDVQLQCNVPNHELIECPIPVDTKLKSLDEPTERLSRENTLQTGEPTLCEDLAAENALQLQCNVPKHELIECPIPVDNNLKLLDDPIECLSQENTLQTGEPTQCDDLAAENAIFSDNSYNAHPSSTYSPETSGLLVQPQESTIPDDAFLSRCLVENQETISPKDITTWDSQCTQHLTLPSSEEDQLVSAPTASNPELSILDSSDPSASRILSDACQTKLSGGVQEDLHSDNYKVNSVYSLESKQDFGLKALLHGGCESVKEKPPTIHLLSEPTIPLEEAASKSQVTSGLNAFPVHQEGDHLDPGIPTCSTDLNDEPSEQGPEQRSHDSASDGDLSELDIPPSNKAVCGQVEPETYNSSACSSEGISSSLASNVSPDTLPDFTSSGIAMLETSSQLPFEQWLDEPVSSFPLHDVEEPPPLPPLPPVEWRRGKLRPCSLSSGGNLCQPLSGTNSLMAPSATDWNHGDGLLEDEGEMVKLANPFVTMSVSEAKSSPHGLFKSCAEKMHPFRLSELPPVAGHERYLHDAPVLEGKIVHPSNPSLILSVAEDEKHLSSHNAVGEAVLQPSNPFASLSVLEDDISQHPTLLWGETVQPSEATSSQLDQLLTGLELGRSQESGDGHLSLERETTQPLKSFLVGSDIEDEKHQYGYGICGGENMQLLQSSMGLPTTAPELPKLGCVTSREENQSSQYDVLPTPDDENLNAKPHSIRSRPRDPLIEAVAAHDRSMMRKVSEMVLPSNKPKVDERDSLLEQIRNKSFNLKPAVVTKSNIKAPPTNLKVAAIMEKASAIRQAFVGSDEDDDEDSWTGSSALTIS